MKLNLSFSPTALLAFLRRFGSTLALLAVAAVFGYTGWVINAAFNVQPAATDTAAARVVFDKQALETVKQLQAPAGPVDLGRRDPFGN
jgi:hypothetical protein